MLNPSKIRIAGVLFVLLVSMPHFATAQAQVSTGAVIAVELAA